MSVLAIIPARGGSKGIPRKNVRRVAGKPLVAHTIEQARHARHIDRVVVSTDDAEVAAIARQYGAEVIWRPDALSGDTATSESALLHGLDHLREAEGYTPDLVVFLQCTSPLTLAEDIDGVVQALLDEAADSALAVTPFHHFLWRRHDDGEAEGINHDKSVRLRRQDKEPQFLETGAVYVMRTPGFKAAQHRFFGKTALYAMPPERCLEIDEPEDLLVAETLMREQHQQRCLQTLPDPIAALVLDFDGVFTDNKVLVFQDGREAVLCNRGDGWGLAQLKKLDLPIWVLSTEENPVVRARCEKLGIPCLHGVQDKLSVLQSWLDEHNIDIEQVVFVGNDVNDLACLEAVGCGVVVQDAHPDVRAAAQITLSAPGGEGAIRELTDLITQKIAHKTNASSRNHRRAPRRRRLPRVHHR